MRLTRDAPYPLILTHGFYGGQIHQKSVHTERTNNCNLPLRCEAPQSQFGIRILHIHQVAWEGGKPNEIDSICECLCRDIARAYDLVFPSRNIPTFACHESHITASLCHFRVSPFSHYTAKNVVLFCAVLNRCTIIPWSSSDRSNKSTCPSKPATLISLSVNQYLRGGLCTRQIGDDDFNARGGKGSHATVIRT